MSVPSRTFLCDHIRQCAYVFKEYMCATIMCVLSCTCDRVHSLLPHTHLSLSTTSWTKIKPNENRYHTSYITSTYSSTSNINISLNSVSGAITRNPDLCNNNAVVLWIMWSGNYSLTFNLINERVQIIQKINSDLPSIILRK